LLLDAGLCRGLLDVGHCSSTPATAPRLRDGRMSYGICQERTRSSARSAPRPLCTECSDGAAPSRVLSRPPPHLVSSSIRRRPAPPSGAPHGGKDHAPAGGKDPTAERTPHPPATCSSIRSAPRPAPESPMASAGEPHGQRQRALTGDPLQGPDCVFKGLNCFSFLVTGF
jgi:hypothetical protein